MGTPASPPARRKSQCAGPGGQSVAISGTRDGEILQALTTVAPRWSLSLQASLTRESVTFLPDRLPSCLALQSSNYRSGARCDLDGCPLSRARMGLPP